jgi:hypothetical protein
MAYNAYVIVLNCIILVFVIKQKKWLLWFQSHPKEISMFSIFFSFNILVRNLFDSF